MSEKKKTVAAQRLQRCIFLAPQDSINPRNPSIYKGSGGCFFFRCAIFVPPDGTPFLFLNYKNIIANIFDFDKRLDLPEKIYIISVYRLTILQNRGDSGVTIRRISRRKEQAV